MSNNNSSTTRQRRGQTTKDSSKTTSSSDNKTGDNNTKTTTTKNAFKLSATDQLARAEETVYQNKVKCDVLYGQWKHYLMYLSYIVVFLSFHQAQLIQTSCIKDIKSYNNNNDNDDMQIDGKQAFMMVMNESACEIINIILSSSLAYFTTYNKNLLGNLSSRSYTISCLLIPIQIGLYFILKDTPVGCLRDGMELSVTTKDEETAATETKRMFPISIVFHVILTCAYWFMERGTKRCNGNIVMIQSLKNDLKNAKEKQTALQQKQKQKQQQQQKKQQQK